MEPANSSPLPYKKRKSDDPSSPLDSPTATPVSAAIGSAGGASAGNNGKRYVCKWCLRSWPTSYFRNSQQFGAHCSNCSRKTHPPALLSAQPVQFVPSTLGVVASTPPALIPTSCTLAPTATTPTGAPPATAATSTIQGDLAADVLACQALVALKNSDRQGLSALLLPPPAMGLGLGGGMGMGGAIKFFRDANYLLPPLRWAV